MKVSYLTFASSLNKLTIICWNLKLLPRILWLACKTFEIKLDFMIDVITGIAEDDGEDKDNGAERVSEWVFGCIVLRFQRRRRGASTVTPLFTSDSPCVSLLLYTRTARLALLFTIGNMYVCMQSPQHIITPHCKIYSSGLGLSSGFFRTANVRRGQKYYIYICSILYLISSPFKNNRLYTK